MAAEVCSSSSCTTPKGKRRGDVWRNLYFSTSLQARGLFKEGQSVKFWSRAGRFVNFSVPNTLSKAAEDLVRMMFRL